MIFFSMTKEKRTILSRFRNFAPVLTGRALPLMSILSFPAFRFQTGCVVTFCWMIGIQKSASHYWSILAPPPGLKYKLTHLTETSIYFLLSFTLLYRFCSPNHDIGYLVCSLGVWTPYEVNGKLFENFNRNPRMLPQLLFLGCGT